MTLRLFAHDQSIERPAGQGRRHGDTAHERVSPKGETGDGGGVLLHVAQHGCADQSQALTTEADGLAVDVMLALAARSQLEGPPSVGLPGKALKQEPALVFGWGQRTGHGTGRTQQRSLVCAQRLGVLRCSGCSRFRFG